MDHETGNEFNARAKHSRHTRFIPVARPASRVQIEELRRLLATPERHLTLTPKGWVTRSPHGERDRRIAGEIQVMQRALELRKNGAEQAFNRAVANKTFRDPKRTR